LIAFQLASSAAIFFNILLPLAHRSADDPGCPAGVVRAHLGRAARCHTSGFRAELKLSHGLDLIEVPSLLRRGRPSPLSQLPAGVAHGPLDPASAPA